MARRTIQLDLTIPEERALAALIAWTCNNAESAGVGYDHLRVILDAAGRDEIGRINAALNGT